MLNYFTMMLQLCFFLFFSQEDRGRFVTSKHTRSVIGMVMLGILFCNFGFHILMTIGSVVTELVKKCRRKGMRIV